MFSRNDPALGKGFMTTAMAAKSRSTKVKNTKDNTDKTDGDEPSKQKSEDNKEYIIDLWRNFKLTQDLKARDKLFEIYRPLSKQASYKYIQNSLPYRSLLDPEDIESFADFGLLNAIDSYDITLGVKFKTFAYTRIRGAIIDGLREMQNFPRIVSKIKREVQYLKEALWHEICREPTLKEISERFPNFIISMNDSEIITLKSVANNPLVYCNVYNQIALSMDNENNEIQTMMEEAMAKSKPYALQCKPYDRMVHSDAIDTILNLLKNDPQERLVIYCYYFLGMTTKKITEITKLSSTWVSLKKQEGLKKLRAFAKNNPELREQLKDLA